MMRCRLALALLVLTVPAFAVIEIYSPRYEESGRVLVQMRPIFEGLGATVVWDGGLQQINARRGSLNVVMRIDRTLAFINGREVYLDVPPRLVGSTTRVPLRFVGESFGATVEYLGDRVRIQEPARETIMVYLEGSGGGVPPGPGSIEGRWPFTSTRAVHNSDLSGRSNWTLTLMRNEIYARRGRPFTNANIRGYFEAQPWYSVCPGYRDSWVSTLEHSNAAFILSYQNRVFGSPADHP